MSDPTPAAPKKGSSKTIIIIAAVVLAAGGGGGYYWYTHRPAPEHKPAAVHPSDRGIVGFEPFVVNLADAGSSRFLRANVQLIVEGAEEAEKVTHSPVAMMQARSAVLELLTVQTSDTLVTPAGKAALKKAIAERVGAAVENVKVVDVLFSDFVVQF